MPSKRNSELTRFQGVNRGTRYDLMHGPFENFGVFNGQFEQGPSGQAETDNPEGWIYTAVGVGADFLRDTGGYCGNWCARGGNANLGAGIDLWSQKFMPVNEAYVYSYQMAAYQTGNGTIRPGVECYDAAKASLGTTWMAAAFIPGAAWTLYSYLLGPFPGGPVPTIPILANTRYLRLRIRLQANAALTGAYVYVNDLKLQQVQHWLWALLLSE